MGFGWDDVWNGAKRVGKAVITGGASEVYKAGKDVYNDTYGKSAQEQKDAYDTAAGQYKQLGNDVDRRYRDLNYNAQQYFNPAEADLQNQRNNKSTQQQDYLGRATDRANMSTNAENYLGEARAYAAKPTNEENYLGRYEKFAAQKTNQENLLSNDTYGNGPTDVESLYQARLHGGDPAAAYEDSRATEALDNQLAARGGYNSGAGVRSITDYYANANAQRSKQMADLAAASSGAANQRAGYRSTLASGADTSRGDVNKDFFNASSGADRSRLDVNDAYAKAANSADTSRNNVEQDVADAAAGASKENSDYYNNISQNSLKLASDRAGISEDLGTKAIEAYKSGQVASIQAYLAKSGVDAATIQAFVDTLSKTVKAGTEIASAAA